MLTKHRRVCTVIIAVLATLSILWVARSWPAIAGLVLGEILILVPLAVAIRSRRRTTRELRDLAAGAPDRTSALDAALRAADEERDRLRRLVQQLGRGPAGEAGQDALAAADQATALRRRLLRRRDELVRLRVSATTNQARRSLGRSIGSCEADLDRIELQFGELSASVAALVDGADDGLLRQHLDELAQATERATALAAGFEEIEAIDPPLG